MMPCPDDDALRRLIADMLALSEQPSIEQHLSDCERCRNRLDSLAGVTHLNLDAEKPNAAPAEDSPSLLRAMHQLNTPYTPAVDPSPSTLFQSLPGLEPSTIPGHVGRLGDYELRRVIAHGGMSIVFEGVDARVNRTVAIKVLSPRLLADVEARFRLMNEAQAAAGIEHENVLKIYVVGQINETPYLVLQYVRGETLQERLKRETKLPIADVVRIGLQLARGLAAAHDRGLVHRDIKPANILLDGETGDVRIADFGLAKHLSMPSITSVGTLAGTPAFMSPEQASDAAVDARSDLFSAGVVLYLAATGVPPFAGESPFVVLDRIRTATPKPLRELDPTLPAWFCSIVERLLEKQPEHRIAAAAKLAEMLERETQAAAIPKRRINRRAILMAAVALGLVGFLTAVVFLRRDLPRSPPVTGFTVSGATFFTLAEAVNAAADTATIDVHGDGPYASAPINIKGKRLTIRAAPGATPVFVPDLPGDGSRLQFLTTDADLRLEGLDIDWPVDGPPARAEDFMDRCVVTSTKGRLTMRHCRVSCGKIAGCIVSLGGELTLERCHLVSPGGCLGWRTSAAPLRVEHCVLDGRHGVIIQLSISQEIALASAAFVNNTIRVRNKGWNIIFENAPRRPLKIAVERNVIDAPYPVSLFSTNPRRPVNTHTAMSEALRTLVAWTDDGNVYQKDCVYLSSIQPPRWAVTHASDLRRIDQWLAYWRAPTSRSIEGKLRFERRLRLAGVEEKSGPMPANVGAEIENVGPGEAYHRGR